MAFAQSTRSQSWVVKSLAKDGIGTHLLKPFEFGLFDYDKSKAISNPSFSNNRKIFFASGSPNEVQKINSGKFNSFANKFNVNSSFKSDAYLGSDFNPLRIEKPQKNLVPYTLYLGYDGINDCKSLDFECGKVYEIYIQAYGSDLKTTFPNGISDVITVRTPDCDKCDLSCYPGNLCHTVIDEIINKFNHSLVTPFITAEKVMSCCPADTIVKTIFTEYCLTLCDTGDELALAAVQTQYPTLKVKRKSRVKTLTTYEVCQIATDPAPVNFVQTSLVIPNCPVCDPGFTLVPGTKVLSVVIDNSGLGTTAAQWLAEVQTVIPTAIAAERLSFEAGNSTYVVRVPSTYVIPSTPLADTTVQEVGTTEPYCTNNTVVNTAWNACGTKYKIKRTLCMQMENPDCNAVTPELPEIIALYEGIDDVVTGSVTLKQAGTCQSIYELEQWNNECLEDGCDTIAVAKFNGIRSYKGHAWDVCPCEGWTVDAVSGCPIPPVGTEKDCRCGIKFTGSFFDFNTGICVVDPTQTISYDPIRFEVSVTEQLDPGNPSTTRAVNTPITYGPSPQFIRLNGRQVLRDVLQSRYYRREKYIHPDAENGWRMAAVNGLKYGVDVNAFYYGIIISGNAHGYHKDNIMNIGARREIALWFEESDLPLMQQTLVLLNKYFTSNGMHFPITI